MISICKETPVVNPNTENNTENTKQVANQNTDDTKSVTSPTTTPITNKEKSTVAPTATIDQSATNMNIDQMKKNLEATIAQTETEFLSKKEKPV